MSGELIPQGYGELLDDLKARVRRARVTAALSVNRELVLLYWQMGREILDRQHAFGWGGGIIEQLSRDLRRAFPEMRGFSARNLWYMRAFAEAYPDEQVVRQFVAGIPWGHNLRILDSVADQAERQWYVEQCIQHGWSRNVLVHQIESGLYRRQGRAVTNFERTLPPPQSDLANQILKDPYSFDFLTLGDEAHERDLHRGLVEHLRSFLLELGVGFAFVGSHHRLEVDGQDFYLDLLFYHLTLRCFVVVELKVGEFKPEYAGKMNFYLSATDDLLRHRDDQPSVGLILCKTQNRIIAEYALRDTRKPIGVAEYRLTESLPDELRGNLPTVEELEAELSKRDRGNDGPEGSHGTKAPTGESARGDQ